MPKMEGVEPQPGDDAGAAREALHTEVLAGLKQQREGKPPKEEPAEAEEEPKDEDDSPEGDAESESKEGEEPDEEKDDAEEEEPEEKEEAEEPKADEKASKGLEAVHRAKRRFDEQMTKEKQAFRSEVERVRGELTQVKQQVDTDKAEVAAFKAKFKGDPVGAALALKLIAEEDLEYVGKQFYFRSKSVAEKPEYREQAERDRREREASTKAEEALRRAEEIEKRAVAKERELEQRQVVNEYFAAVESAAGDETPLLKSALKKQPKRTREELQAHALRIAQSEQVEWPEHADVVKAWETAKRAELADLGIDINTAAKAASSTTKTKTPVAGEKKRPGTMSNDLGTTKQPRSTPKSREEELEDVLKDMRAGRVSLDD